MNSTPQLDFHPDAESLNAFAEKALPERELGQVLAHLAVCSRCRQVIFLAQKEAAGMEMVAAAAAPAARSTARSGSWLSGWRLAWIPAAALAASVALFMLVHVRHVEPGTETARVATPVAPQNEASVSSLPANNRVVAGKTPTPAFHGDAKRLESKTQSAPAVTASAPLLEEALPSPAPPREASANALSERETAVMPTEPAGQDTSAAQYKPVPIPGARQRESIGATYSSNATAGYAPRAKTDEMEERATASQSAKAQLNGSGGVSASRYHQEAVPRSSYDAGAHIPAMQFEAAPETKTAPLPSGLPVVSTVTSQDRTLAIDQAGALFVSEDSGSSWVPVARQWTGRAVEVRVQQPVSGGLPSGGGTAAAAVFEIVNDQNQIWVSMDGKSWKAR